MRALPQPRVPSARLRHASIAARALRVPAAKLCAVHRLPSRHARITPACTSETAPAALAAARAEPIASEAWAAPHAALRALLAAPGATTAAAVSLARASRTAGAPLSARVEQLTWAAAPGCGVPPAALLPDPWRFVDKLAAQGSLADALAAAAVLPKRAANHNRLVWRFCQADRLDDALAVLAVMKERGPSPTLATYRVLLIAAGKGRTRRLGLAVSLVTQLRSQGLVLDARTVNVLLNALAAAPAAALRTYETLVASGAALDVVSFNTMLKVAAAPDGLSREGRIALARRLLRDLACANVAPNAVTLAAAVAVLGGAGQVDEAFRVWTEMRAGGVAPCARGWTALLSACRTAGQYDRCLAFFRAMCESGLQPSRHHWNVVIDAAVRAGLPAQAAALATEMAAAGVKPDLVTRNSLLRGTAALRGLDAAFKAASTRDAVTWAILVDLCAEAGDVARAAATMDAMRSSGMPPDVVTWTALLKAHAAAGDAAAALSAYRDMRAAAVRPNAATFLTLLRACRAARDVERATVVYQEMRRAGVRPQNGAFRALLSSWVDAAMDGHEAPASDGAAALPAWLLSAGQGDACAAQDDSACLDLHGLSSAEARAAVLCKLRALRQADAAGGLLPPGGLLLITGRGRNSARGVAVLRDATARLCAELRLRCDEDADNPGRMVIPAEALREWLARQQPGPPGPSAATP
jgi:pentatricopeptide repeat protein